MPDNFGLSQRDVRDLLSPPRRVGKRRHRCRCGHRNTARQINAKGGACPHCGAPQRAS